MNVVQQPLQPAAVNHNQATPPATPAHIPSELPPKMTTHEFCDMYQIGEAIRDKLLAAHITGPHALCELNNAELIEETHLKRGEIADVCKGEKRWYLDWERLPQS